MKTAKQIRRVLTMIALATVTTTMFGQGCGQFESLNDNQASLQSGLSCGTEGIEKIEPIPGRKTASIVYGKQVLDNMVACTGIGRPSPQTLQEYEDRKASFSEYGYATQVSAPMLMGIAAVAGEVCNDLITQEDGQSDFQARRVFRSVDLAGASASSSELESALELLAVSCWQRMPDESEKQSIVDGVRDIGGNARTSALTMCTTVLSSLSAITM